MSGRAFTDTLICVITLMITITSAAASADGASDEAQKGGTAGIIETVAGDGSWSWPGDGALATEAGLAPLGLAFARDGSLYIVDSINDSIRRVGPEGKIKTVAGNGSPGFSGDGGPAIEAQLAGPGGVAVAADGSLYIADRLNHRVRRIAPDGVITTLAGTGVQGFGGDGGPATMAQLSQPYDIALDPDGSLYISDKLNRRIRKVSPDGIITTVAGNGGFGVGGDGGPATEAELTSPFGIALGPDGSLYIADHSAGRVRRVAPDGIISTVGGNRDGPDGGLATDTPADVVVGPDGSLYIADSWNDCVRRVDRNGIVSTIAGNGMKGYSGDGGLAIEASLYLPMSVAVGPDGDLYISDRFNRRIRRVRLGTH